MVLTACLSLVIGVIVQHSPPPSTNFCPCCIFPRHEWILVLRKGHYLWLHLGMLNCRDMVLDVILIGSCIIDKTTVTILWSNVCVHSYPLNSYMLDCVWKTRDVGVRELILKSWKKKGLCMSRWHTNDLMFSYMYKLMMILIGLYERRNYWAVNQSQWWQWFCLLWLESLTHWFCIHVLAMCVPGDDCYQHNVSLIPS